MKLFLGVAVAVLLAIGSAAAFTVPSFNDLRDNASMATIPMSMQLPDGNFRTFCTAVAVGDAPTHYLVTARHCMEGSKFLKERYYGDAHVVGAKEIARDSGDTVMLWTPQAWPQSVQLTRRIPHKYEHVFSFGYPIQFPKLYREGTFAGVWKIIPSHSPWKHTIGKQAFGFSMNIGPGDSGGGIFNKDGELVCVNSFGSAQDQFEITSCIPPAFTPKQLEVLKHGP